MTFVGSLTSRLYLNIPNQVRKDKRNDILESDEYIIESRDFYHNLLMKKQSSEYIQVYFSEVFLKRI